MNKKYHQYTTSIPWYTVSIPWYTVSIPWYTVSIPTVYHQYTTSTPLVYHQYTTSIPQRPLQVWIRDFVFTWWCNETFSNFSLKIALHCIALNCIALHCSIWSAFQFKADSTEIYESSMNLFLLVFSLTCISIKTRQHWDLREFCFCFSACDAFQFVTTVCTSYWRARKKRPKISVCNLSFWFILG